MQATMTCAGLDVHARSTHAAAIDLLTGELRRARLGAGTDPVVSWLGSLPGPVRAAYEAGPTGFGLARAAAAAGIEVIVAAPSKTPRAKGDRVKSDRKDAELLARLLVAGQLKAVAIPPDWLEAIRHVARTREQVRRDLGRARHRVSKLLLVEGRVYPAKTTRNADHRRWLAAQQFDFAASELAFIDLLSAVDGLAARREALDERLSRLAADERLWPTVARLRAFRGVDTLTALALHLELGGDWQRFASPRKPSSWLGLVARPVRRTVDPGLDHQDRLEHRAAAARRGRPALRARTQDRRHPAQPPNRPARPHPADRLARPAPPAPHPPALQGARQTHQPRHDRRRPRTGRLPLGRRDRAMT
jgi:transposase